jgi:MFS family permease
VDSERRLTVKEELELMGLLFLHGMALASWFVPLGSVLDSANLGSIKPVAFAAFAIAALLSPLFFGAMADRSVAPAKVLRWISVATSALVTHCLVDRKQSFRLDRSADDSSPSVVLQPYF